MCLTFSNFEKLKAPCRAAKHQALPFFNSHLIKQKSTESFSDLKSKRGRGRWKKKKKNDGEKKLKVKNKRKKNFINVKL